MALKRSRYPLQGVTYVRMTKCPCGYEFSDYERRSEHFLEDHTADDVPGLSNRGDRA
ncbi:hypothetical protein [Halorussus pelagicus]|uniref:hypothetical protein n=1 Tax=Halorussus pelagicus TaxID=2505977 RepID=UPI001409B4F9|nr:hypothetical protein [Halorussus pelagicus]